MQTAKQGRIHAPELDPPSLRNIPHAMRQPPAGYLDPKCHECSIHAARVQAVDAEAIGACGLKTPSRDGCAGVVFVAFLDPDASTRTRAALTWRRQVEGWPS